MRQVSAGPRVLILVLIAAIGAVGLPVLAGHSSANITGTSSLIQRQQ